MMLTLVSAGAVCAQQPSSADTLVRRQLQEIVVKAPVVRRQIATRIDGSVLISPSAGAETPSFMAGGDPLGAMRSLPTVATTADLRAAMNIEGGGTGDNLFTTDGVRVVNPLHLLGFYSTFNPAHYSSIEFRASRHPATAPNLTSGYIGGRTATDTVFSGSATIGIIESHASLRMPINRHLSIAAAARQTYIDQVFPSLLKLDNDRLTYGFTDLNLNVDATLGQNLLSASFFTNRDRMTLRSDLNGAKDGRFGWRNFAAGINWSYRNLTADIATSRYSNRFSLREGGRDISLPSSLLQLTARFAATVGSWEFETDANRRLTTGQPRRTSATAARHPSESFDINAAASFSAQSTDRLSLRPGLRLSLYTAGGYTTFIPQPRLDLRFATAAYSNLFLAAERLARFDRLVEESTAGLPTDFWTLASPTLKPTDVIALHAGFESYLTALNISYSASIYGKLIRHAAEFGGSIVDLAADNYNPLDNMLTGNGYAIGLNILLSRRFGKVGGNIAYNLGRARNKLNPEDGNSPAAHDRTHDLNLSLSWYPLQQLTISAAFVYATGTPYTRERFGYMIGENLICEYFPHNSSRLPDYRRLDLSATLKIASIRRISHQLQISVYNALGFSNTLFRFTHYSVDAGIEPRESVMKMIIPSVAYTINFR